jgi:hypothetical protein
MAARGSAARTLRHDLASSGVMRRCAGRGGSARKQRARAFDPASAELPARARSPRFGRERRRCALGPSRSSRRSLRQAPGGSPGCCRRSSGRCSSGSPTGSSPAGCSSCRPGSRAASRSVCTVALASRTETTRRVAPLSPAWPTPLAATAATTPRPRARPSMLRVERTTPGRSDRSRGSGTVAASPPPTAAAGCR